MSPRNGWGHQVSDDVFMAVAEKTAKTPLPPEQAAEIKNEAAVPVPPEDKMIEMDIYGRIGPDTVKPFVKALGPSIKDDDRHRVIVNLISPGGGVSSAFHIIGLMEAWPEDVVAISGSQNCSASTMISAAANLRLAYSNARFMIHDMKGMNDGSIVEQEERLRSHKDQRQAYAELFMDHIGLTKKEFERLMARDHWFNASEAMHLGTKGLIDGIILKNLGRYKFQIMMREGIVKVVDLHKDDFIQIRDTVADKVKAMDAAESVRKDDAAAE